MGWTGFPLSSTNIQQDWIDQLVQIRRANMERANAAAAIASDLPQPIENLLIDPEAEDFHLQKLAYWVQMPNALFVTALPVQTRVGGYDGQITIAGLESPVIPLLPRLRFFLGTGTLNDQLNFIAFLPAGAKAQSLADRRTYMKSGSVMVPAYDQDPDIEYAPGGFPYQPGDLLPTRALVDAAQQRVDSIRWFVGSLGVDALSKSGEDGTDHPDAEFASHYAAAKSSYDSDPGTLVRVRHNPSTFTATGIQWPNNEVDHYVDVNHQFSLGVGTVREIEISGWRLTLFATRSSGSLDPGAALPLAGVAFQADIMSVYDDPLPNAFDTGVGASNTIKIYDGPTPKKRWLLRGTVSDPAWKDFVLLNDATVTTPTLQPMIDPDERQVEWTGHSVSEYLVIYRFDVPGGFEYVS